MNHTELIDKLLRELNTRVGIVNIYDKDQQSMMSEILTEWGEFDAKKIIFEFLTEADPNKNDDRYVSIGYGRYKEKGKEDDEEAPTYEKDDRGNYVKLDKKDSDGGDDKPKVNIFNKDYNKRKEPKEEPKEITKAEKVEKVTKVHKESEQLSKSIYGDDLNKPTLQKSVTSDEIINRGYERDKYYTAPGNAGSAFNEVISNEVALILKENPDLSEEQLTSIIYHRFGKSKLAQQQAEKTRVESPSKKKTGIVPEGVEPHIWRSCIIAARSGKAKYDRASKGVKKAQQEIGFGSDTTTMTFGGTSRNEGKKNKADSRTPDDVVPDLEALENEIDNANAIFVYDEELDKMVEIPKDVMKEWVASSGGGENAADTAVITKDENGNLIYDGWSDKKGLNDLQGNSTLNDDYTKQSKNVDSLLKSKQIDEQVAENAKIIIQEQQKKSEEIESEYDNAPKKEAEYFRTLSGQPREKVIEILKAQEKGYDEAGTKNHVRKAMEYFKVDTHEELLDKLIEDSKGKSSKDRMKIITRAAIEYKKALKSDGEEIPAGLDTKQILSNARKKALDLQRETVDRLNQLQGKTKSGKTKQLGDMLGFQETIDFLHIDKIETPSSDKDYKSFLKRNTQLVMAGVAVKPENIKNCLGVKNLSDYEDNFEVITEEKFITDRDKESGKEYITGKTVLIYAVNKEGTKTYVGEKAYRSKSGKTGKTSNTIKWSKEMQTCFDSN